MKNYKIAVVGGGASGMTAAIFAARKIGGSNVVLCEALPRFGKKLLATGNGRCNITNSGASAADYYSDSPKTLENVLNSFSVSSALDFFRSVGIESYEESEGRIYPLSEQASSVLDMLRFEIEKLGICCITDSRISGIKKLQNGFILSGKEDITAEKVIIACGGMAAPNLGGCSDGVKLLTSLGHKSEKTRPALTQLKTDSPYSGALKGSRAHCVVSLLRENKTVVNESGEVLFADNALSGIAVFNVSRFAKNGDIISLRLLPDLSKKQIYSMLERRAKNLCNLTLENYLNGMLNKRIANCVLKASDLSPLSRLVSSLNENELKKLCDTICSFRFTVIGLSDWKNAQVTRGGALLSQFDSDLQSKICKGIFACGETLNVDGKCGGYNLQWAWSSGAAAGLGAAKKG